MADEGVDQTQALVEEPALDRQVHVRTGTERFRSRIEVRGHVLAADEPETVGGADLGPTPYDLLCAALGSCTTITLRMYADRKGWPVDEISAAVRHSRIAVDGEEGEQRDRFEVRITLAGELAEEQVKRLVEIAERCPVHRTLARGATVDVTGE